MSDFCKCLVFDQCQNVTSLCLQGKIILVCVLLGSYNFEARNSTLSNSVNKVGSLLLYKKRKVCASLEW